MSHQKNWVFTINNPSGDGDEPAIVFYDSAQYCIYQMEVGENGTCHYQGYIQFKVKKRIGALKALHATAHWEPRRGSHAEAKEYCMKEDTRMEGAEVIEWGEEVTTGQRSDLESLKCSLDEGKSLKDISDDHFGAFLKYSRSIKEYQVLHTQNNRDWATFTQVYWGPPGTGKTKRALHEGGLNAYWLPKPIGNSVWFDGYDGQEVVVIDEFFGWLPRDLMCRMCDRYPLLVQVKGGTVPFLAKKIIITSNAAPAEWWTRIGLGPMERRLSGELGAIEHMDDTGIVWAPEDVAMEEVPRYDSDVDNNEIFEGLSPLEDLDELS